MNYPNVIELREAYYSAGDRYGWSKELGDRTGFGVDWFKLIGTGNIYVETRGKTYQIDKDFAKEVVRHYNSLYKAKNNKQIAVIPKCLFYEQP